MKEEQNDKPISQNIVVLMYSSFKNISLWFAKNFM